MKWLAALAIACTLSVAPVLAQSESEKHAATEKDMAGWEWANFVVLAGGLGYLAVKMGGPYFAARSQEIRKGIADAEKLKAEADQRVAAVNAKMASLDAEIQSIRETIRAEGARERERLQREGAAGLARIAAHVEQEVESMSKAARNALRKYSAELALKLAEQKIRSRMTPDVQDELARSFVQQLASPAVKPRTSN
jgi:F-type H+-transporting ATPase subunit b